MVIFC